MMNLTRAAVDTRGLGHASNAAPADEPLRLHVARAALVTMLGVLVVVLVRTAWICDDAYINFRTIDNFVHGYGLRWNVAERVQTFTDPLWLFLVSAAVAVTREYYFTTIFLSLGLSAAAVVLYATRVAADDWTALAGVLMFIGSKAFVDYSSGGLENPLAHALIVAFLAVYGRARTFDRRSIAHLTAIATLCALTRMDTVLLLAPALLVAVFAVGLRRSLAPIVAGASPLILWEIFSIVYYGQPLPNTAYAKLGGGIPGFERAEQGFYYLLDSLARDPPTLTIIGAGVAAPFAVRAPRDRAVASGMVASLVYVVSIGGDFMSGRFLAAPFLCGVILLTRIRWTLPGYVWAFPIAVMLVAAAGAQVAPFAADRTFHHDFQDRSPTVDERRVYYQYTGLLNAGATGPLDHPWARHGREVLAEGEPVTVWGANGFFGFTVGRRVHVIDPLALGDVLLARLPAESEWRPGHLLRRVPAGYEETLASGEDHVLEPSIAELYERIRLIVRGPLFGKARLLAIWRLNTGGYEHLIDTSSYGLQRVKLADLATPMPEGMRTERPGVRPIREGGIEVAFDRPWTSGLLEASLDANDDYLVVYNRNGRDVCHELLRARVPHSDGSAGLAVHSFAPPLCARGFDRLRIYGRHGYGPHFLGHLRQLP